MKTQDYYEYQQKSQMWFGTYVDYYIIILFSVSTTVSQTLSIVILYIFLN